MRKLFVPAIIVIAVLYALSKCNQPSEKEIVENLDTVQFVESVFDVPFMINTNMDIDQVRKSIGPPVDNKKFLEPSKQQMKMNFSTWDNQFEKDGYMLLVTFNPKNRQIIDFFINPKNGSVDAEGNSGVVSEYKKLLAIVNVREGYRNLRIVPVPSLKDGSKYTGVKIIPTN